MISPFEFEEQMQKIADGGDIEASHAAADDLMCKVLREWGFAKGCDIFEKMERWYA